MNDDSGSRKQRVRSPNFPGIALDEALEKARVVYEREKRNPSHVEVIHQHWGYKPGGSEGSIVLSALVKYGLLQDQGSGNKRTARLTDEAWTLLNDPDAPESRGLLKKLALYPSIHAEIWKKYSGSLPSDPTLKRDLVIGRGFNERGATRFIKNFRRTIGFAGLSAGDIEAEPNENETSLIQSTQTISPRGIPSQESFGTPNVSVESSGLVEVPIVIPADHSRWPLLRVPNNLSETEYDAMVRMIEAMKPGLVRPATSREQDLPSETSPDEVQA